MAEAQRNMQQQAVTTTAVTQAKVAREENLSAREEQSSKTQEDLLARVRQLADILVTLTAQTTTMTMPPTVVPVVSPLLHQLPLVAPDHPDHRRQQPLHSRPIMEIGKCQEVVFYATGTTAPVYLS